MAISSYMDRSNVVHTLRYYSFIIINDEMLLAAAWIGPEDAAISKIIQMQTDKFCILSLTCRSENADLIEIE